MAQASGRATGGQLEERIDLTEETNEKLNQASSLVQASPSNLASALALLASIEKKARVGNDTPNLVRVCEASLQLCKDCNDDESLVATIKNLTTRRSQKTKAIAACVNKACPWVLDMSDGSKGYEPLPVDTEEQKAIRERLVITLRDVTEGKMFLEAERARLTRALAIIKEQDGDIPGAADILHEVHAETYGSLSKREKVEFILEQMRLTLGKKDYVRAAIVGNKINRKTLQEEGMEDHKIKFFTLMSEYHRHDQDAFELAKDYHAIYMTSTVQQNEDQWKEALGSTVLFLALSPYSMEQQDMLHRIRADSNLEKLPPCNSTITNLLKKEIISYPIPYQAEMEALPAFLIGGDDLVAFWKKSFRARIIQHNIRVASSYYQRIQGKRLAQLLGLSSDELESEISSMVSNGEVYAKIDRPMDIIKFKQNKSAETVLSDWAADIGTLMNLVDTTSHLIQKENMTQ
jgi:26S proteasome regulatory subunit N5